MAEGGVRALLIFAGKRTGLFHAVEVLVYWSDPEDGTIDAASLCSVNDYDEIGCDDLMDILPVPLPPDADPPAIPKRAELEKRLAAALEENHALRDMLGAEGRVLPARR